MWEAVSSLIRLVLELVRELPEQVRTPAVAAWCMAGLFVVALASLISVDLLLPEGHWASRWLIGALVGVGLLLLMALTVCVVFIVVGVIARFFGRR